MTFGALRGQGTELTNPVYKPSHCISAAWLRFTNPILG